MARPLSDAAAGLALRMAQQRYRPLRDIDIDIDVRRARGLSPIYFVGATRNPERFGDVHDSLSIALQYRPPPIRFDVTVGDHEQGDYESMQTQAYLDSLCATFDHAAERARGDAVYQQLHPHPRDSYVLSPWHRTRSILTLVTGGRLAIPPEVSDLLSRDAITDVNVQSLEFAATRLMELYQDTMKGRR